jgi:hypothetical protein
MNKSNFNLPKTLNEYYYININNNNVNNYKDTHSSAEHWIEYILPPIGIRVKTFLKRLKYVSKALTIFKKFTIINRRENREISYRTVTVSSRELSFPSRRRDGTGRDGTV